MLSTINGFDLLLILIIVALGYRVYSLNRECESYVGQILRLSWDLSAEYDRNNPPFGEAFLPDFCDFCTDSKPREIYPECTCAPF